MKRGSGPILNPELKTLPAMYKVQLPPGRLPSERIVWGGYRVQHSAHTLLQKYVQNS